MLGKSGKKENEKKNLCAISLLQVVQKGTSQKKRAGGKEFTCRVYRSVQVSLVEMVENIWKTTET